MTQKQIKYYLIISLIFIYSCRSTKSKNIYGVWLFDTEINTIYLNDTTEFRGSTNPIIFDFKKNKSVFIKNYENNFDTIYKWKIKSDKLLIDTLKFKIKKIDDNTLVYLDNNRHADTIQITLKKVSPVKIKYSKKEIENILLSKIWAIKSNNNKDWRTHFEYFDNNTMIYRYEVFSRNFNSIRDNLQYENWGISEYKNNYFLYNNRIMGHSNKINQILDIDSISFTISNNTNQFKKLKFISKKYKKNNYASKQILGKWKSKNSTKKNYGRISKSRLKYGRSFLFNGNLKLTVNETKLFHQLDTLNYGNDEYKWRLSKDARILIIEHPIVGFGKGKGVSLEFFDILELNENKLKVRLFDNMYNNAYLNLIQEFKKY